MKTLKKAEEILNNYHQRKITKHETGLFELSILVGNRKSYHIGLYKTEKGAEMAYKQRLESYITKDLELFKEYREPSYINNVVYHEMSKQFVAKLRIDSVTTQLGYFDKVEDAIECYQNKVAEIAYEES